MRSPIVTIPVMFGSQRNCSPKLPVNHGLLDMDCFCRPKMSRFDTEKMETLRNIKFQMMHVVEYEQNRFIEYDSIFQ